MNSARQQASTRLYVAGCSGVKLAQALLLLSHNCMAAAWRTTSSSLDAETQLCGASDAPMPQHYYEEPNPDRSALHRCATHCVL